MPSYTHSARARDFRYSVASQTCSRFQGIKQVRGACQAVFSYSKAMTVMVTFTYHWLILIEHYHVDLQFCKLANANNKGMSRSVTMAQ